MARRTGRARRFFPAAPAAAALAALVAAGCGVSSEMYNIKVNELERSQAELGRSQNELNGARERLDQTRGELERRDTELAELRAQGRKLAGSLSATEKEMGELRRAHQQAADRAELYRSLTSKLQATAGAATVEVRRGRLLIRIGDAPLFDAGQAALKPDGRPLLKQVAQLLKELADRDFLVGAHTDNRPPPKEAPFSSNWELSAARAVSLVRFFQAEGVDPRHLAATGYSEFDAIDDNDVPDKRARNRRVEIVVLPKPDELPAIDLRVPAPSP